MQIEDGKVAIIHYTLTDDEGEVIDSSRARDEPMPYLHGAGNIVKGLEAALTGLAAGDTFEVAVAPEDGYGEATGETFPVPRTDMPGPVAEGMQFFMEREGARRPVWIASVGEDEVLLTGDHPMAGKTLNFEGEVVDIRDATPSEREHGHTHGLDGHAEHHHESPTGQRSLRRRGGRKRKNKKKK